MSEMNFLAGRHLVFIHGWALNSGVWSDYIIELNRLFPDVTSQCIDLPGYGRSADETDVDGSIESLAQYCLDQVDRPAIWVGWSLGGMVAMQAAISKPSVVQAMQLICTSPKFVAGDEWPEGVEIESFRSFSTQLADNYQRTLTLFLLMQAGANKSARDLAKTAHQAICQWPNPSASTLNKGIKCLADTDLRLDLEYFRTRQLNVIGESISSQVISGLKDRVAKPASSVRLASLLGAELVELDTGHAPFMTEPSSVLEALNRLAAKLNS